MNPKLCLWISLFCTFPINGLTSCVSFCVCFSHWASCSQGPSLLQGMSVLLSFSWSSNIQVHGGAILFIIPWWALELFLPFFKKIYFWLCWVFVAAHRLSLVVANGDYSLIAVRGLFIVVILLLWNTGSRTRFNSIQFSHSVMCHSLQPHESQHARPPCPSPAPGVYSNSCLLSQWCHPTISSSAVPFSSHLQSFSASGYFPMSKLITSSSQSIRIWASTSVLPMNTQDWFPLGWARWIFLKSKELSRFFSNTTVQKHQFFGAQATHSSILAWRIPWTQEPGRLQSTGSQRARHDWATSLSLSFFLSSQSNPHIHTWLLDKP